MSAARWPLAFALLTSCASTVTGTTGVSDAALDSPTSDIVLSDGSALNDLPADRHADVAALDPRCPQRPCLAAPLLRAAETATWILFPDGRTFLWGTWGPPFSGGNPDVNRHDTATAGPRLSDDVIELAPSFAHLCALAAQPRRVICWGENTYGQLGRGTTTASEGPDTVAGIMDVEAIAARGRDSWALTPLGVFLWGSTSQPGARGESSRPRLFPSAPRRTIRFVNGPSSYDFGFLTSDGEIFAFGQNLNSASGSAGDAAVTMPTRIAGISTAVDYSAGPRTSCVVLASGAVYCWGERNGILSQIHHDRDSTAIPERVSGIDDAVRVHVGEGNACVLTRTRTVRCWGAVDWERDASTVPGDFGYQPVGPTMDLPPVRELAVGGSHACALTMADEVYCWGSNVLGQLGIPRFYANSNRPRRVPLPQ